MFIIHGRYPKKESIGRVADYCPTCKSLREFEIADHFEGTHLYFIPIGKWQFVMTAKKCRFCETELVCEKLDYATIIPVAIKNIPFDQLLQETNPKLAATIRIEAAEEIGDRPAGSSSRTDFFDAGATKNVRPPLDNDPSEDAELQRLFFRLADHDVNDPDLFKLKEKLNYWRHLSDDQRAELGKAIDGYCSLQARLLEIKDFLVKIDATFPKRASCVGCLLGLLALGASCPSAYLLPTHWQTWYWVLALYVGSFVTIFVVFGGFCGLLEKYWIDRVFLATARAKGIQLDDLLVALRQMKNWSAEDQRKSREVWSRRQTLIETVSYRLNL